VETGAADESAWRATSAAGRFRITIRPEAGSIPIGALHAWIVTVETPEGRPVEVRQLVFDGGMPQHGHGFETKPEVTDRLGPGVFRVDGLRFHMAGSWRIRVDVAAEGVADAASFDVEVRP
jgi:YtkA-like